MSGYELLRFAARAMRGHRLRTVLSVLGVAIGISSVMVLTSLGEGARRYVTNEFQSLGSNLIIVVPGKTETEGEAPIVSQAPNDLTVEDMEAIVRRSPRVKRAAPVLLGSADISYGARRREVTVFGTTADMQKIRGIEMSIGRFLPEGKLDRSARVCVIGSTIQREVFGDENPLGAIVRVGTERYRVIGVLKPRGMSIGFDLDDIVEIPVKSAMGLFDRSSLFRVFVEVRAPEEIDGAAADIRAILKERHDDTEDVTIIRQDSVIEAFGKILGVLTAALAAIAAISLAVAGIGIMNVMLVSVTERTGEIGLLKALGAGSGQILSAFLAEASLLSGAGGVIGVAGGFALAALARSLWPALPAYPPTWAVAAALAVSVAVGLAFGSIPARRASRLDPVNALARRGR